MPTPTERGAGDGPLRVAFVCVQNAGRSQMAHAFARRELSERGLEDDVELLTGGTSPADRVHGEVVEAMADAGFDLSGRTPRGMTREELGECDYVVTMGCSADGVCPATWTGESRDWDLDDPDGRSPETVAAIRDEIARCVSILFDELAERADRA